MTTATIQIQEVSFAGAPPQAQGEQPPSLSFQELLGSSQKSSGWEEGEGIAVPMIQATDEKKKAEGQEVPQLSSSAAAALAAFAMANAQGEQVAQTAQTLHNTDGAGTQTAQTVQTAQAISHGAGGAHAAGYDTHAAVTAPEIPTDFSSVAPETQQTAPEGPVFQIPDVSIGFSKEMSADGETQPALSYPRAEAPKEVLQGGEQSGRISPLSHDRPTEINPLEGGQTADPSAQAEETADLQPMHSPDAGQEREPLKAPQAPPQPSIPQKEESGRADFVQGGQKEPDALKKPGESQPTFEPSSVETHTAKEADAFIPLQRKEMTSPEEKTKATGEQAGQASAVSTFAPAKTQPLADMREINGSEGTEIPLAAEQISQGVQKAMKENTTEFFLKLKPEGLGQVTVRVRGDVTDGKRNLILDIRAESGATQKLISEQVGKLTADLSAGRYDSVDVHIGTQVPDSSLHSGFSREGTGQNHGETKQFFGETLQQHKENTGMPLRFYRGGMLNCTA